MQTDEVKVSEIALPIARPTSRYFLRQEWLSGTYGPDEFEIQTALGGAFLYATLAGEIFLVDLRPLIPALAKLRAEQPVEATR
jgi:hypothetical protein